MGEEQELKERGQLGLIAEIRQRDDVFLDVLER